MKKTIRIISVILTLVISMSTIGYAGDTHECNYYAALGDSVTAGSELNGYSRGVQGFVKGAYPWVLTQRLGLPMPPDVINPPSNSNSDYECKIPEYKYGFAGGICGIRTHELRILLDDNYTPDDYSTNFFYTYCKPVCLQWLQDTTRQRAYREAIKNADIITLNIGNNELLGTLCYVLDKYSLYEDTDAITTNADEVIDIVKDEMNSEDNDKKIAKIARETNTSIGFIRDLINELIKNQNQFRTNWNWIMKYIYENNPDADVYVIGLYNPSTTILNPLFKSMNNFMRFKGKYHCKYTYVDIWKAGAMIRNGKDAGDGKHPNYEVHEYIADRIYTKIKKNNN